MGRQVVMRRKGWCEYSNEVVRVDYRCNGEMQEGSLRINIMFRRAGEGGGNPRWYQHSNIYHLQTAKM